MKKIAFKTTSVLLFAVLLVAALPIAAFAEEVSPCVVAPCNHIYQAHYHYTSVYHSNAYHVTTKYKVQTCTLCGSSEVIETVGSDLENHHVKTWTLIEGETDQYEGYCEYCGGYVTMQIIWPEP